MAIPTDGAKRRFLQIALDRINTTPHHPLKFLVDPKTKKWKSTNPGDWNTHTKANFDRPGVNAGHRESSNYGGRNLALEDAWLNQRIRGGYKEGRAPTIDGGNSTVLIGGIPVDKSTAQLYENHYVEDGGEGLPKGSVANAPTVRGWDPELGVIGADGKPVQEAIPPYRRVRISVTPERLRQPKNRVRVSPGPATTAATGPEPSSPSVCSHPVPDAPAEFATPENIMREAQKALDQHVATQAEEASGHPRASRAQERGFAEVGGVLFTIAAVCGAIYVISQADHKLETTEDVVKGLVIEGLAYKGAETLLKGAGVSAGTISALNLLVGFGTLLQDDRSEGQRDEIRKRTLAAEFVEKRFPEIVKRLSEHWGEKGFENSPTWKLYQLMEQQAYDLLFNTQPIELPLRPLPPAPSTVFAPGPKPYREPRAATTLQQSDGSGAAAPAPIDTKLSANYDASDVHRNFSPKAWDYRANAPSMDRPSVVDISNVGQQVVQQGALQPTQLGQPAAQQGGAQGTQIDQLPMRQNAVQPSQFGKRLRQDALGGIHWGEEVAQQHGLQASQFAHRVHLGGTQWGQRVAQQHPVPGTARVGQQAAQQGGGPPATQFDQPSRQRPTPGQQQVAQQSMLRATQFGQRVAQQGALRATQFGQGVAQRGALRASQLGQQQVAQQGALRATQFGQGVAQRGALRATQLGQVGQQRAVQAAVQLAGQQAAANPPPRFRGYCLTAGTTTVCTRFPR